MMTRLEDSVGELALGAAHSKEEELVTANRCAMANARSTCFQNALANGAPGCKARAAHPFGQCH
jgi:hypothetical protein